MMLAPQESNPPTFLDRFNQHRLATLLVCQGRLRDAFEEAAAASVVKNGGKANDEPVRVYW